MNNGPRPADQPPRTPGPVRFYSDSGGDPPLPRPVLRSRAVKVLRGEQRSGQVDVILTTDSSLRRLNREFRGKDKTTDVLSFPWSDEGSLVDPEGYLGEIYISLEQVERQAPRFGATPGEELERVLVHGLLHLCGYDHLTPSERRIMREKENLYLTRNPYSSD